MRVAFDVGGRLYTYAWPRSREPLQVGDVVEVPANWAFPEGGRVATVVAQGSDYTGPIATLVRKMHRDSFGKWCSCDGKVTHG